MWPQGWNSTAAFLSEQTTHSSIWNRTKKWGSDHSAGCFTSSYSDLRGGWGRGVITLVLDWTWSLQMRHFFTRGEQREQVAMCPQGPNSVSLFMSEHTMHSSSDSMLLFRDGLRVPTCPLDRSEKNNSVCVWEQNGLQKRDWQKTSEAATTWTERIICFPSPVMADFYGNTPSLFFLRYSLLGGYDLIYFYAIKTILKAHS